MNTKIIKLFMRFAISIGFLSAVADRFGFWPVDVSTWGSWEAYLNYIETLVSWLPEFMIPVVGILATAAQIVCAACLIAGYKTELFAKLSGYLLLIFAFFMTITHGIKSPIDYSVIAAAAAAFGLSLIKEKFLEIDSLVKKLSYKKL